MNRHRCIFAVLVLQSPLQLAMVLELAENAFQLLFSVNGQSLLFFVGCLHSCLGAVLRQLCYVKNKLIPRRVLCKSDYLYTLDSPAQDLLMNSCSGAIDVVADAEMTDCTSRRKRKCQVSMCLLHGESVYRHNQEVSTTVCNPRSATIIANRFTPTQRVSG
jgi:hypothetical protein